MCVTAEQSTTCGDWTPGSDQADWKHGPCPVWQVHVHISYQCVCGFAIFVCEAFLYPSSSFSLRCGVCVFVCVRAVLSLLPLRWHFFHSPGEKIKNLFPAEWTPYKCQHLWKGAMAVSRQTTAGEWFTRKWFSSIKTLLQAASFSTLQLENSTCGSRVSTVQVKCVWSYISCSGTSQLKFHWLCSQVR